MSPALAPSTFLAHEARALLARLAKVESFALRQTTVPAAAVSTAAQAAIERCLVAGRRKLREDVHRFVRWLHGPDGRRATPAALQRRFTLLRLRFNVVLTQFDIFASALTQRSEHDTGVWLAGLDALAEDALNLPGAPYEAPPLICYLDRGMGAAIRRARTRLPGGDLNPVAIIRVPRERMVSTGIGSSLVHEVGHQGAALLDIVPPLRLLLQGMQRKGGVERAAWTLWERWISEIVADLWSIATLGVGATLGLMSVVSLPSAFVFRMNMDDPHPPPWIRVKLSCAIGEVLFPHAQWQDLARLWERLYPSSGLDAERQELFAALLLTMPSLVTLLVHQQPRALRGRELVEVLPVASRQPAALRAHFRAWQRAPPRMRSAPPTLVFAVFGQARADGAIGPEEESRVLTGLLSSWALKGAIEDTARCAAPRGAMAVA